MMKIAKKIRRFFCKHSGLQYENFLYDDDEINAHNGRRYVYECMYCGARVWRYAPYSCVGCRHLYLRNDGGAECDLLDNNVKICISNYRLFWEEERIKK